MACLIVHLLYPSATTRWRRHGNMHTYRVPLLSCSSLDMPSLACYVLASYCGSRGMTLCTPTASQHLVPTYTYLPTCDAPELPCGYRSQAYPVPTLARRHRYTCLHTFPVWCQVGWAYLFACLLYASTSPGIKSAPGCAPDVSRPSLLCGNPCACTAAVSKSH